MRDKYWLDWLDEQGLSKNKISKTARGLIGCFHASVFMVLSGPLVESDTMYSSSAHAYEARGRLGSFFAAQTG